jgi:hypothetical protein
MSTVDTLSQDLGKLNQINTANKEFLDKLSAEVKKATDDSLNAKTALDKEIGNRVGLEQQVSELNEQMQTLAASKGDLEKQVRELTFWLNKYEVKYGKDVASKGAPGVVNAVRGQLVSISVGSADGVAVGDNYNIRRGASYVGRIRITTVDKNLSVGMFDAQNPGSGAPPQAGDSAYPGEGD